MAPVGTTSQASATHVVVNGSGPRPARRQARTAEPQARAMSAQAATAIHGVLNHGV